jgi:hypothetical protein
MSTRSALPLEALDNDYTLIGELGARDQRRSFLARRNQDGRDVLIVLANTPAGDEKHALTHLAADANLLARLEHRNLVRVLDGHWLGDDAFAVVSERPNAPSLRELLERGEPLSTHRVAAILKEVNELLEWAREQGVVHRVVTPDSLHLEPATDRVCAAFVIRPLPATGAPGPEGDARTIASLARALLTGRVASEPDERSLGELRPDLPERIIAETDVLLHASRSTESLPDVRDYIARIAMLDALREGEDELARVRTALYAERRELERTVADETRRLEEREAELERTYSERNAELERTYSERNAELERTYSERSAELERRYTEQHGELDRSIAEARAALEAERAELQRSVAADGEALTAQRQTFERAMADERRRLAEERAALERYRAATERRRLELERRLQAKGVVGEEDTGAPAPLPASLLLPVPDDDDALPPMELAEESSPSESMPDEPIEAAAAGPDPIERGMERAPTDPEAASSGESEEPPAQSRPRVAASFSQLRGRRSFPRWAIPAGVLALAGFVTLAAVTLGGDDDRTPSAGAVAQTRPAALSTPAAPPPVPDSLLGRAGSVVDSAAGGVEQSTAERVRPAPPRSSDRQREAASDPTTRESAAAAATRDVSAPSTETATPVTTAVSDSARADSAFVGPPLELTIPAPVVPLRTTPLRDSARSRPIVRPDSARTPAPVRRDSARTRAPAVPDSVRVPAPW